MGKGGANGLFAKLGRGGGKSGKSGKKKDKELNKEYTNLEDFDQMQTLGARAPTAAASRAPPPPVAPATS